MERPLDQERGWRSLELQFPGTIVVDGEDGRDDFAGVLRGEITMEALFDGFDHTQYEDEVRQRWGDKAWEESNNWWNSLSASEQQEFRQRTADVNGALRRAAEQELSPDSEEFQQAVADHHAWLADQPNPMTTSREAYLALADMYVADDRFAATYGGTECARRIRQAIGIWTDQNLCSRSRITSRPTAPQTDG